MLIIKRAIGQVVALDLPDGRRVLVKVVNIRRPPWRDGRPRAILGVEADRGVRVNRKEVQDAIDGIPQGAESQ